MPGINITPHMQYNEDNRIKINVPFLQDRIVLHIDSSIGTIHEIIAIFVWQKRRHKNTKINYYL